jgi:hypothetical protein
MAAPILTLVSRNDGYYYSYNWGESKLISYTQTNSDDFRICFKDLDDKLDMLIFRLIFGEQVKVVMSFFYTPAVCNPDLYVLFSIFLLS